MNFLINVNFKDTHSLKLTLIDPGEICVFSAVFDGGSDQELPIFFEAPADFEVWDILGLCIEAYKEFKSTEGTE